MEAIDATGVVERQTLRRISIGLGHDGAGRFEHALRSSGYLLKGVAYDGGGARLSVALNLSILSGFDASVPRHSHGRGAVRIDGDAFIEVPVLDLGR